LVARILNDLKNSEKGKSNLIINKCWNVIRFISEVDTYVPKYIPQLEDQLKPLFNFMENPDNIDFDDDIILVLSSFIKKSKEVSPTQWIMFPQLPKFFDKFGCVFGNLFQCANYYIIYGKEDLAQNKESMMSILDMAIKSMFTHEESIIANNAEGCFLLQVLIQTFKGTDVLNDYFEKFLGKTVDRLNAKPMSEPLKRALVGVILCCFHYEANATMKCMFNLAY
jgi:hypothetical protein